MKKRMSLFGAVSALLLFNTNTVRAVPVQRVNSCVVMEVGQAQVEGERYSWEFELTIPGSYLVQLITATDNAHGDPATTVDVDGVSFIDSLVGIQSFERSSGKISCVRLLGSDKSMKWTQTAQALQIDFTGIETGTNGYAIEVALEQ